MCVKVNARKVHGLARSALLPSAQLNSHLSAYHIIVPLKWKREDHGISPFSTPHT